MDEMRERALDWSIKNGDRAYRETEGMSDTERGIWLQAEFARSELRRAAEEFKTWKEGRAKTARERILLGLVAAWLERRAQG